MLFRIQNSRDVRNMLLFLLFLLWNQIKWSIFFFARFRHLMKSVFDSDSRHRRSIHVYGGTRLHDQSKRWSDSFGQSLWIRYISNFEKKSNANRETNIFYSKMMTIILVFDFSDKRFFGLFFYSRNFVFVVIWISNIFFCSFDSMSSVLVLLFLMCSIDSLSL